MRAFQLFCVSGLVITSIRRWTLHAPQQQASRAAFKHTVIASSFEFLQIVARGLALARVLWNRGRAPRRCCGNFAHTAIYS